MLIFKDESLLIFQREAIVYYFLDTFRLLQSLIYKQKRYIEGKWRKANVVMTCIL
jgi:hypothetical protein